MKIVRTIGELRAELHGEVGLVPTMGALHDGHLSLFDAARAENEIVVASLFVNAAAVRRAGRSRRLSARRGGATASSRKRQASTSCSRPTAAEMYPPGFATWVDVDDAGARRAAPQPGHFRGVATVCVKLFNIVEPRRAYFGQKDAQQAIVVRRVVRDLNIDVQIRVLPTVRDEDGLALSSRNARLSAEERARALALPRALAAGAREYAAAATQSPPRAHALNGLTPDYVELIDLDGVHDSRDRRRGRRHPAHRQRHPRRRAHMSAKPPRYASWTAGKLPLPELMEMKRRGEKIVMVTAYDAPSGRLADAAGVDLILVGDSSGMVLHGRESTVAGDARRDRVHDAVGDARREAADRRRRHAVRLVRGLERAGCRERRAAREGRRRRRREARARRHVDRACARDRRRGHPRDGSHRFDAADGDGARRLQGAGPHRRPRAAARRRRARAPGRRLLRDRARGGAGDGRARGDEGARRADDRHRRRRATRTVRCSCGTTCSATTRDTRRGS